MIFFDRSLEISQPTTSVGGQGNAKFKLQSSTFNAYFTKMNSKCVNICFFLFIYAHTSECRYLCKCVFVKEGNAHTFVGAMTTTWT